MTLITRKTLWTVFCLFFCLALAGCGRKGPPVPPSFKGLKPPVGVAAAMEGEQLVVSWDDPAVLDVGLITGYRIDLSTLNEGEELCEGCPMRFETAGMTQSFERTFAMTVSTGALYTVEVRAKADGGYVSAPSRRVSVDLRSKE